MLLLCCRNKFSIGYTVSRVTATAQVRISVSSCGMALVFDFLDGYFDFFHHVRSQDATILSIWVIEEKCLHMVETLQIKKISNISNTVLIRCTVWCLLSVRFCEFRCMFYQTAHQNLTKPCILSPIGPTVISSVYREPVGHRKYDCFFFSVDNPDLPGGSVHPYQLDVHFQF